MPVRFRVVDIYFVSAYQTTRFVLGSLSDLRHNEMKRQLVLEEPVIV